jgi:hypothetical protein
VPAGGFLPNVAVTLLACSVAAAVFLVVTLLADGGDLRAVRGKLGARLGVGRGPGGEPRAKPGSA